MTDGVARLEVCFISLSQIIKTQSWKENQIFTAGILLTYFVVIIIILKKRNILLCEKLRNYLSLYPVLCVGLCLYVCHHLLASD